MAFSTYNIIANTVQAQTISKIGSNLSKGQNMAYTLADGSIISVEGVRTRFPGYVPKVGDYLVVDSTSGHVVWPAANFAALYASGAQTVTVRNSAGSVTRTGLAVVGGVVTLAATDAIVANGGTAVLHKSDGTVSSGNATLNSPVTYEIAAGVVTDVKAGA